MNKYEEKAKRIMERGDILLENRKRRIIKISRITGEITGLCAVFAIGFGIWNNTLLKDLAKPPVIDESSIIVPVTEVTTAYQESTVQGSSEAQTTEINITTKEITNETHTEAADSAAPSVKKTSPVRTGTPAGNTAAPAQTSVTNMTRVTAIGSTALTDTAASATRTSAVTEQVTGTHTMSPIPPETTAVTTEHPPVIVGPVSPPTKEFIFGEKKYVLMSNVLGNKQINEYLGSLSDTAEIYSISGTPIADAVAVKNIEEGDNNVYFLYCNLLQKYTDSERNITYTKSYENDFPEDIFIFEKSVEISEYIKCLDKTIHYNVEIYYLDGIPPNEMIGIKNEYSGSIDIYYS